jgi:hypothetical protein
MKKGIDESTTKTFFSFGSLEGKFAGNTVGENLKHPIITDWTPYKNLKKVYTPLTLCLAFPEHFDLLKAIWDNHNTETMVMSLPDLEEELKKFKVIPELESNFSYLNSTKSYCPIVDYTPVTLTTKSFLFASISVSDMSYEQATIALLSKITLYTGEAWEALHLLMWCVSLKKHKNLKKSKIINGIVGGKTYSIDLGILGNIILRFGASKMSIDRYYILYIQNGLYKKATINEMGYYKDNSLFRYQFMDKSWDKKAATALLQKHIDLKFERNITDHGKYTLRKLWESRPESGWDAIPKLDDFKNAKKPAYKKKKNLLGTIMSNVTEHFEKPEFTMNITEQLVEPMTKIVLNKLNLSQLTKTNLKNESNMIDF